MFVVNGEIVEGAFICGKTKSKYLKKKYGIEPFFNKDGLYFFSCSNKLVKFPWYLALAK